MSATLPDLFAPLAAALAQPDQPEATFVALDQVLGQAIGHRFLSMLVYRWQEGLAERIYSSRPEVYPRHGRKAFTEAPTQRRVAEGMQPYIGRDAADIRRDFPDHDRIFALGCESILNMPVIWAGRAIGQVNLLHEAGHYGPDHLPLVRCLAQMAIPAFLAAASQNGETSP